MALEVQPANDVWFYCFAAKKELVARRNALLKLADLSKGLFSQILATDEVVNTHNPGWPHAEPLLAKAHNQ